MRTTRQSARENPVCLVLYLLVVLACGDVMYGQQEPPDLVGVRERYRNELRASIDPVRARYLKALEELKRRYTQKGDLSSALAVDNEIKVIKAESFAVSSGKVRKLDLGQGATLELVWISPGTFLMGSNDAEVERPIHRVRITKGFWMGKYEVTQAQWEAVMGSNTSRIKGSDYPVENLGWDEAMEFCKKIGARLPTEAEWEYACRAGTTTRYYTGDRDSDLDRAGWYMDNSGKNPRPVGQKAPNAFELYDIHGNVWEWCADWAGRTYPSGEESNPVGPSSGQHRVTRGGSNDHIASHCRSAFRNAHDPQARFKHSIGFRVCLDIQ